MLSEIDDPGEPKVAGTDARDNSPPGGMDALPGGCGVAVMGIAGAVRASDSTLCRRTAIDSTA
jgi:hypothetical protein